MRRRTRALLAGLSTLALGAVVAGCTNDAPQESGTSSSPVRGGVSGPADRLTVLAQGPVQAWDPQRMTHRPSIGFASRTWLRTLTAYPPDSALSEQRDLVGDLGRDTGRPSKDAKTWTFRLRPGVTWQDGSSLTCEDVRYGVARSFDHQTPSSGYALTYLDIPKKPDGSSTYPGPGGKGRAGAKAKKLLDKAVECPDSTTVVFHLAEPVGHFDEIVSLPEFAPFKESKDGPKATYAAYSSGPYRLKDGWTPSKGGTWVRNAQWSASSDPLRERGPKSILHREGVETKDALAEIVDGPDGGRTLALDPMPPSLTPSLDEAGELAQSVEIDGQIVDYLAVNTESTDLRSTRVRRALAAATDREAYATARGAGSPTWSLLGTTLPSTHETVLDHGPTGDVAAATKLISAAEVSKPVELTLAYREGMTESMEALQPRWREAGFDVTLEEIEDEDYFDRIATRKVAKGHDVVWANWGPDFPSAATVLPPLFDDRVNLTGSSVGRDYGLFADKELNKDMDQAVRTRDPKARARAWQDIDTRLLEGGVYLPLLQSRLTLAAGSEVISLVGNPVYGGVPEMGVIGVGR